MKKFIYPFAAFFLVLYLLLSFNEKAKETNEQEEVLSPSPTTVMGEEKTLGPEEIKYQYQEAAKSIVLVLEALVAPLDQQTDLEGRLEGIDRLNETIFAVRVPAEYQALHVQLASIADDLERLLLEQSSQDINNRVDLTEIGGEIDELINEYPWLKKI